MHRALHVVGNLEPSKHMNEKPIDTLRRGRILLVLLRETGALGGMGLGSSQGLQRSSGCFHVQAAALSIRQFLFPLWSSLLEL